MSNIVDNTRQYLLNASDIPKEEKEYTMNFCKKTEYLNSLRDTVINEIHDSVAFGYGDVNSKICFVFPDEETFQLIKPVVQDILETFKLNFWDIYVTFINKTKQEYSGKYGYLINELYAIGPKVLYVVDKTEDSYNNINRGFATSKIPHPSEKAYHISIEDICSTEPDTKKQLWKMFKYLINYRN
jgi:hypothetical protein